MVTISSVQPDSPAAACRLRPGDRLISVNGHPINDFLDYEFYTKDNLLQLEVETDTGLFGLRRKTPKKGVISLEKGEEPLGLNFDSYLMDEQRTCRNNCIFCFIDQMPPGMRPSLYVKDDDDRLSFLFGNYITMTNLPDEELTRIITMHISPVNVSVHTTNPQLRCAMMHNRFAGNVMERLTQLTAHGIVVNCQLVLCPGYNDGKELERTLADLDSLGPMVASVSAVPVGKTKFRQNLTEIPSFNAQTAADVIAIINRFGDAHFARDGRYLFHASDEFYLTAGLPLPGEKRYDDFSQLENGVGMCTLLENEFDIALDLWVKAHPAQCSRENAAIHRRVTIATGVLAAPILTGLCEKAMEKIPGLGARVVTVQNDFFGREITVAGLICGGDLVDQLRKAAQSNDLGGLGDTVLITCNMLESTGTRFLDDMTLEDAQKALGVPVQVVGERGADLLDALLGQQAQSVPTPQSQKTVPFQ